MNFASVQQSSSKYARLPISCLWYYKTGFSVEELHAIITENTVLAILLARQRALLTPVTCPDTKFIGIT